MAMSHKQQIDPKIYAFLSELVNVPTLDAKLALEGRAHFFGTVGNMWVSAYGKKVSISINF